MNVLEIVDKLRAGHYVEFARAAATKDRLIYVLWQLLCRETQPTQGLLSDLMIKGVGVPVFTVEFARDAEVKALLLPASDQGSIFAEKGLSLAEQARLDLASLAQEARFAVSEAAQAAAEILKGIAAGDASLETAGQRFAARTATEGATRALFARSGDDRREVEMGADSLQIGGAVTPPEWLISSTFYTLCGAQVSSPARNGQAIRVFRGADNLPGSNVPREIEVQLGPETSMRARVQIALATAVPVELSIQVEERVVDAKRRYLLRGIRLPADIRDAIDTLLRQAELF